jgi:hypothetical protein
MAQASAYIGVLRPAALSLVLCLAGAAAMAQPLLPRCGPGLDGQVSQGGCTCAFDHGGSMTGRAPGWRWSCDLLRGPGAITPVPSAGDPPQGLPPGFVYAPRGGGSNQGGYNQGGYNQGGYNQGQGGYSQGQGGYSSFDQGGSRY